MPPRAKDNTGWTAIAHDMTIKADAVAKAAEQKDVERVLQTGGELYETCTACHTKYVPQ
jgi:cytochrome c556